jgi:hypothetical protein
MMSLPTATSSWKGLESSLFKGMNNKIGAKPVEVISEKTRSEILSIADKHALDETVDVPEIASSLTKAQVRENFLHIDPDQLEKQDPSVFQMKPTLTDKVSSILSVHPGILFYQVFNTLRAPHLTIAYLAYNHLRRTDWKALPGKLKEIPGRLGELKRNMKHAKERRAIGKWQRQNSIYAATNSIIETLKKGDAEKLENTIDILQSQCPLSVIYKALRNVMAYNKLENRPDLNEFLQETLSQTHPDLANQTKGWWDRHKRPFLGLTGIGLGLTAVGLYWYFNSYLPRKREEELKKTDTDADGISDWDEINIWYTNPNKKNPNLHYAAYVKKLPMEIDRRIITLDGDGKVDGIMTPDNQALMDYLGYLYDTKPEVVSPEVSKLVAQQNPGYKDAVINALAHKAVDDLVKTGKVPEGAVKALPYLSTFDGQTQRMRIEHGLDEASLKQLSILSQHTDKQFAQYAVKQKLGIEDHLLTPEEVNLLISWA